jgi:hypothetical protein
VVDGLEIVREFLIVSGTGLYALVGTRISNVPEMPKGWDNTTAAIWFDASSGTAEPGAPAFEDLYTFHCYPGNNSLRDSRTVARALHDRLHQGMVTTASDGAIMLALNATGNGLTAREPDSGFPVTVNQYRIKTI